MDEALKKCVVREMRNAANKIDASNSALTEDEAMGILSCICHESLSKAEACSYMNTQRSNFDKYVREGKIPRGKKKKGSTALVWYKDELIKRILKRNKNVKEQNNKDI